MTHADESQPHSATVSLQLALPPEWPSARQLRQKVNELLGHRPESLRQAAAMTASELLENAIKHGGDDTIQVAVTERDTLEIRVENVCRETSSIEELRRRIEHIVASPDPGELYFARLQELMADPDEDGKLGLLRIAFEGKFTLSCSNTHRSVSVVATRHLGANPTSTAPVA